jgi:hypothetical protein
VSEWAYFGFEYYDPGTSYVLLSWILAFVPAAWMPIRLSRPSHLIYWVLYITAYIPSIVVPLYAGLTSPQEWGRLASVLFVGFAVIACSYACPLRKISPPLLSQSLFWSILIGLVLVLSAWMIIVFRRDLHIVSFNDVYFLRDAANDMTGSGTNFAFMITTGALYPLLMGAGLYYKRKSLILAGMFGQLLIYSIAGTKGSILSIVFVPCMYLLLKVSRLPFGVVFLFSCLTLLGGTAWIYAESGGNPGPIGTLLCFVVLMRTLAINGLVTAQYFDFFQKNPFTLFSHVTGINWVLHYPYSYPIGMEIGLAYQGTTGLDQTGSFWAMDGLAGLGLAGVLLVSGICAVVFWCLDSVSQGHDPKLPALMATYEAYNLANISLFTSLWSGGLGAMVILLYWMPRKIPSVRLPAETP